MSDTVTKFDKKFVPFEFKRQMDDDGVIEGWASVFDIVDLGMDVMDKAAFTKSLGTGRKVRMLWQHDPTKPIGVWDEIKVVEKGLWVKGRIAAQVALGREAMALIGMNAIEGLSIGYRTVSAIPEGGGSVRRLIEVDLYEISIVTMPMLPDAVITDLKAINTVREFEKALRDAGFNQRDAKAITADGFKGLASQRDVVVDQDEVKALEGLKSQLKKLQETINAMPRHERSNKIL